MTKNDGRALDSATDGRAFTSRDLGQIIIGACILVVPQSISDEAWTLGRDLPMLNIICIALASYLIIGTFVYFRTYYGDISNHRKEFWRRVVSIHGVTLVVSALALLALGKLPLFTEPLVAFKTTVLIALSGSFIATVVDGMDW